MFVKPTNPTQTIVLVPHSGIQFVEYSLDIDSVNRFQRKFVEREYPAEERDGFIPVRLVQGWDEDEPNVELQDYQAGDQSYTISKERALEPFLGKWVPIPFLRQRHGRDAAGKETWDRGPTNWARVRVIEDPSRTADQGPRHIAIFAFDTELAVKALQEVDGTPYPYTAPLYADAENPREFRLVSSMSQIGWFLADPRPVEDEPEEMEDFQAWVGSWVETLFREFKQAQKGGRALRPDDFAFKLEHAARWFAFLDLLQSAIKPQKVRFADTVSDQPLVRPVEVDLILDVGNSRTCGILIENYPNQDNTDLGDARVLELRDVSQPERVYNEPFESRVELAQATFGMDYLSRQSGRSRAFFWPSLVRVGPEATRFRAAQNGTEAVGGMSSPKRYLWDVSAVNQEWRFPERDYTKEGDGPPIEKAVRSFVNANGDVLSQLKDTRRTDRKLFKSLYPSNRSEDELMRGMGARLTFSRSSFYTLMMVEVIWQAWCMINSQRFRGALKEQATPRRLRRIILTLPSATPVREQRIMKARAQGAIDLIWDLTGWRQKNPPGVKPPEVQVAWDEATCVQFVWLYGQIYRKFGGQITRFFDLVGKPRPRFQTDMPPPPNAPPESSLRVASIDIGGGTTDLMIMTYFQDDDHQITPVQTFREGFRIAGDDVVKAVIESVVMPAFAEHLRDLGVPDAKLLLAERFGAGRAGMAVQEKQLRRQYVLRVLEPIALALIHEYESSTIGAYATVQASTVGELIGAIAESLPQPIADYLAAPLRRYGIDFDVASVNVKIDFNDLRATVLITLEKVMENLAEAIHHFDCDMVLVSGRPSRLPAVMEALTDHLAVSPGRVLALHAYNAGEWYPFRGRDNRSIADPKTAVVVGATLCLLAEHQFQNFRLATDQIQMRSTARFIGELSVGRQLEDSRIMFRFSDLAKAGGGQPNAEFRWWSTMQIGARQVPHQRWLASPLYQLSYAPGEKAEQPIKVRLEREPPDNDAETSDQKLDAEAAKEDLRLDEATDNQGRNVKDKLHLTFRTMPLGDSYWLDTGVLQMM